LLLVGLLAVLVAMIAGVATITSVFAHHNTYTASRECNDSWSASASYVGGSLERMIVLSDVTINGDAFATSGWNTQSPLSFSTTVPSGVTFASGQAPSGASIYYWKGTYDGTRTIFSRSGGAGTFVSGSSNWGGSIMLYEYKDPPGSKPLAWYVVDTDTVTAPSRPADCDRTIRIHKVVEGSGAPAKTFAYTISPAGITGTVSASDSDDHSTPKNKAQTVTETESLTAGWSFVKYARKQGLDSNCTGPGWSDQGTVQGNGVSIPADSNDYTVCIYNQYTDPAALVLSSSACVIVNNVQYAQFHFLLPATTGVPQGSGGTLSGTYNDGAAQNFGPINEDTTPSNGHPDWTFTLPFGSGASVKVLTASTSTGWTWGTQGRDKDTVSKTSCQPVVLEPGIEKVAARPEYANGAAHWLIKVNNTANTQAVEVKIEDSNVVNDGAVTGGTCTDADISDGEMVCTVNAGATLVVPVKREVPKQCQAGLTGNSATISWKAPGSNEWTSLGSTSTVNITVPADPDLCDKPGITKTATTTSTSDPSAVKWTVTVSNPASGSQGPGTTQTVYIKDTGVNVVSGPTYGGSASCTIPGGSSFEAELTSANGVQCSMPNNSTITFVVKPAGTIARTCEDQKFNNTAYLYIGSTTSEPRTAPGPEITLQGNPELCTRNLEICKVVVGNGDGYIESGTFNFDIREAGAGPMIFNGVGGLSASEPNPDTADTDGTEVCVTKQVPASKAVEVVEWGSRPSGWVGDASGYPQYSINGGSRVSNNTTSSIAAGSSSVKVTFYNKADPRTREIEIDKYFVATGGYVAGTGDVPTFTLYDPDYPAVTFESACQPLANGVNNHLAWTCTVPWDWDGDVTETPADGWLQTQCESQSPESLVSQVAALVKSLVQFEEMELQDSWTFCNRPVGTVVIVKYENVPPATTQNWTFNGSLPGAPQVLSTTGTTNAVGSSSTTLLNVPAGSYTLAELEGRGQCESGTTSSDYQTRGLVQIGGSLPNTGDVNAAPIIGASSLNVTVQKGTTTYVAFGNQGCGTVLSAANLQVIKYSDPAANFTGTTELAGWTISITGTAGAATGFNASQDTLAAGGAFFLGIPDGTYTVCETAKAGWAVVGSKYNLVNQAGVCRAGVVVNLDQTAVVKFYNQPRVNIEVNKTEISLATPAGAPGNGWSFTLTGCGITPQVAATGANGKATFSDLPPAVGCSYTVTETVKSGWSAINPVQVTAPAAAGQTAVLNFTNVKIEVCTNCTTIVTPTPTPPTPTATPTPKTPAPETPTATPETPTQKPTEEATAGARTPGPGQTPIAPSTGNGFMGNGPAGMNMLLALVGLLALSLGATILAIGRRSSRR
jgi:hypothetical protein